MTFCVIKSSIDFDLSLFKHEVEKQNIDGTFYYHMKLPSKNFRSFLTDELCFCRLIAMESRKSNFLSEWAKKERVYSDEEIKGACFSAEYHDVKNKITERAFQAVLLNDDLSVFEVRGKVVGTYKDFERTGNYNVILSSEYVDYIFNSLYIGIDFKSLQGYLSTRSENVL